MKKNITTLFLGCALVAASTFLNSAYADIAFASNRYSGNGAYGWARGYPGQMNEAAVSKAKKFCESDLREYCGNWTGFRFGAGGSKTVLALVRGELDGKGELKGKKIYWYFMGGSTRHVDYEDRNKYLPGAAYKALSVCRGSGFNDCKVTSAFYWDDVNFEGYQLDSPPSDIARPSNVIMEHMNAYTPFK